jgi:hypothetical protein
VAKALLGRPIVNGLAVVSLAMLSLFSAGCLVTDVLEERAAVTPEANHPPRIEEASVEPSNWAIYELKRDVADPSKGCEVTLKIGVVIDEDLGDELYARWFIDYADNPSVWQPTRIPPSDKPERIGPELLFRAADWDPGIHLVRVVISDGFADDPQDPTKVLDGKASTSYTWTIDSTAADCASETP